MKSRSVSVVDPGSTPTRSTGTGRRPSGWLAVPALTPLLRLLVAVMSVPAGQPDRTGCDECAAPIGFTHGLRALSPVGRCAACSARIGAPPGSVELLTVAVAAVLVLAARPVPETLAFAWWGLCAVPLVFIDLAVHRLPDRLTWSAVVGTWALLGLAALGDGDGDGGRWLRALLAGAGVAGLFALTTLLLGRRGFGLGDAKLALSGAALLGWLGWPMVLFGLLVALSAAALVSLTLLAARRVRWAGHLPFGPFLVLGTLTALTLAS